MFRLSRLFVARIVAALIVLGGSVVSAATSVNCTATAKVRLPVSVSLTA